MQVIDIFYVRYYKEDGTTLSIGGIETYITQLAGLAHKLGFKARVFQFGYDDFVKDDECATVYAVKIKGRKEFKKLYNKALSTREDENKYINIIANDLLIPSFDVPNSIVIQHGIGFDYVTDRNIPDVFLFLYNTYTAFKRVWAMKHVDEAVCVDNNYICWYRTQRPRNRVKLTPILNFAAIGPKEVNRSNEKVKIVFARRFVKMRGTRLFAPVAKRLLDEYSNIEITFAGGGPDENYIKSVIGNNSRVNYTSYSSQDSLEFHQQFDIAVVPTLYSEGTSLSLLEAMSAHCAVVCTNIGGMTNIVLDEYNGLMVSPESEEIYNAVKRLIEDTKLRKEVSDNAYETVCKSFSLGKWQKEWTSVLTKKFDSISQCQK